jgi:hypothetical protein
VRAALLLCVVLAGCVERDDLFAPGADSEPCAINAMTPAWALDPATGICLEFSSCDVPAGWAPCMPYVACMDDGMCNATQHCADLPMSDDPSVPPRACVNNEACSNGACADGFYCDTTTNLCARVDPGSLPPAPPAPSCLSTSECGPLEICPAQYGGCSTGEMTPDMPCPSQCEPACTSDEQCGDVSLFRCNAMDVCGTANADAMGNPGPTCAGWCVTR